MQVANVAGSDVALFLYSPMNLLVGTLLLRFLLANHKFSCIVKVAALIAALRQQSAHLPSF